MNLRISYLFICLLLSGPGYSQVALQPRYDRFLDSSELYVKFEDYKLVGLGEGTHASKEYYTCRFDIIKMLVTNYGYRIVFLEASLIHVDLIDKYIQNVDSSSNLDKAIYNLGNIIFKNHDFKEIVSWLKEYNLEHAMDPVHIYGIDYTGYDPNYLLTDSTMYQLSEIVYKEVYKLCHNNSHDYRKKRMDSFDQILVHIAQTKWLSYLDSLKMICFAWSCFVDDKEMFGERRYARKREVYMKDNLFDILTRVGKSAILLAHNLHVAKDWNAIGSYAKKKFPYYSIGMTSRSGKFWAYNASFRYNLDTFELDTTAPSLVNAFHYRNQFEIIFSEDIESVNRKYRYILTIGSVIFTLDHEPISKVAPFNHKTFDAVIFADKITPVNFIRE